MKRLALGTIILTYLLMVFGGYVASSNSGMGCGPDWPLCNGLLIPILKGATLIEFTHRVIGAILVCMTVLLFFIILKKKSEKSFHIAAWGMLDLLIIQVLLGAVVVVYDLPAIIVTIHLLIAFVFLYCLIWIWTKEKQETIYRHNYTSLSASEHKSIIQHFNKVLVLLLLTLAFGAYIKHESYGLACGWLGCGDEIFPVTKPQILQTIHRGLAVATTIYIFVLAFLAFVNKWGASLQKRLVLTAITVLVQLLIGVATIVNLIDVPWAVLHLAIGTLLFVIMSEARVFLGSSMLKTKINYNNDVNHKSLN